MSIVNILKKLNSRDTRLFPHFSKTSKVIIFIIIAFSAIFFTRTIFASNFLKDKQDAIEKGNNQEAWLNGAMESNMMSLTQMLTGKIPFEADGSIKVTGYTPSGALGVTNKMIGQLYSQPVSGIQYIAQVKNNFLGKNVYAKDSGFQGLQPLLPLWKTLRNATYALFSIVFIVIGVMIMLRVKISPQAVITLQNSIPKLITALILVTFSYAIAGLVIDLSNLLLTICLAIFFNAKGTSLDKSLFDQSVVILNPLNPLTYLTSFGDSIKFFYTGIANYLGFGQYRLQNLTNSDFGIINDLATRVIPGASSMALGEIAGKIFLGVLMGGIGSGLLGGLGKDIGQIAGSSAGSGVGMILGGLLIPLIMSILVIFWLIKLYFGLLKCYIVLIFKIIIAPIEIGLGALPNSKMNFSSWIMDVIANISVFPATVLFLVFINYLTDLFSIGFLWAPSQLSMSALSSASGAAVSAGIGIAGLAMLSKLPTLIPEAIFMLKPSPFGKAIGENLGPVGKTVGKTAGFGVRSGAQYAAGESAGMGGRENKVLKAIRKAGEATGYIKKP